MSNNKKIYGYIYRITFPTKKVYIGKTTKTVEERFNEHINKSRKKENKYSVYNAIRRHGEDNIICEEIDKAYSKKELNDKEIYYIDKFKSYYKNKNKKGYNMTRGGEID